MHKFCCLLVSQQFIGNLNVQTKSVSFYVQRKSEFALYDAIIPFQSARLNEGDAFNLTSGVFTVPINGIYIFQFSALKESTAHTLAIRLQVNGENVGSAYTSKSISEPKVKGTEESISLSASLRLAAGDKVNLRNYGALYDDHNHYTHFIGWLVEEDLM